MNCSTKHKISNAVLFQCAWFSCVLLPAQIAVIATTVVVLVHLKMTHKKENELFFILSVTALGYCMDSVFSLFGRIDLNLSGESTIYLVCVWLIFATTLNSSMSWFLSSPYRSIILGILAPVSYYAAQQFGKIKYSEPLVSTMAIHALLWGILMLIVHKMNFDQNIQSANER